MPIAVKAYAGGSAYASPMIGPVDHTLNKKIDLSGMTVAEVDSDGYLKPGLPLKEVAGLLVLVGAAAAPIFMVPEATKLALVTVPPTPASLLTETGDHFIGVVTHGICNLDVIEDNLGRVLTANELASFTTAGTHLALTTT